jgi:diguanylate cyclase (GGDEF)-like protein/PAS domain S-box-containing protein
MEKSTAGPTSELRERADSPRSSRYPGSWFVLLAFAVTGLACLASGAFNSMADEIAPIWLPSAVLLAQLMVAPRRQRYRVFAAGMLGNLVAAKLLVGESLGVALSFTSANILQVGIALVFAPHTSTVAELIRPKPLVKFLFGGVLLAPIASGLFATALLGRQLSDSLLTFTNWFVPAALGLTIFTPTAVALWTGEVMHLLRAENRLKTGSLVLLVGLVTIGVFGQKHHFPLLYWAFPPIVLLAFQADLAAVLVGLLLCFAIALWLTMHRFGTLWSYPFSSMQARIFALQLFMVAALGIALPISATQTQRRRLIALLRDGERRYRVLAEHATDIVISMGLDGRLTYVSPRAKTVLGYASDDLLGVYYPELVLPDDRDALATTVKDLTMGMTEASHISRLRRPDGRALWVETHFRSVIDSFSGKPEALTATVRDVTERKMAEQRLADERRELHGLAFRDGLTGLFNRRHFDRQLALQWREEVQAGNPSVVAVMMVDVDAFKSYNDHNGHQSGDDCLRAVAQTIAASARRPTDVVARYGGEEFALILPDTGERGAMQVAERIRQSVENLRIPHVACSTGIVTVSIGVAAQRPRKDDDGRDLVAAADRALYAAKRHGRNQACAAGADAKGRGV